jgi:hypothetical protein
MFKLATIEKTKQLFTGISGVYTPSPRIKTILSCRDLACKEITLKTNVLKSINTFNVKNPEFGVEAYQYKKNIVLDLFNQNLILHQKKYSKLEDFVIVTKQLMLPNTTIFGKNDEYAKIHPALKQHFFALQTQGTMIPVEMYKNLSPDNPIEINEGLITPTQIWESDISAKTLKDFLYNPLYECKLELVEPFNDKYSEDMVNTFNFINGQPYPDVILYIKHKETLEEGYYGFDVKIINDPVNNIELFKGHISIASEYNKKTFMDRFTGSMGVKSTIDPIKDIHNQKEFYTDWSIDFKQQLKNINDVTTRFSIFNAINNKNMLSNINKTIIPSRILELPIYIHPILKYQLSNNLQEIDRSIEEIQPLIIEKNIFPSVTEVTEGNFDGFIKEVIEHMPKIISAEILDNYKSNTKLIKDNSDTDDNL